MDTLPVMMSIKAFSRFSGVGEKRLRELCRIKGFPVLACGAAKKLVHREKALEWLADYVGR